MLTPSPLLQIIRQERESAEAASRTAAEVAELELRSSQPESEFEDPDVVEEEDESGDGSGDAFVRRVQVRSRGLATPEDLAAAALRHAESRRPRENPEPRFLLRLASTRRGTKARRKRARSLIRERRPDLKRCMVEAQARRPGAIVKGPSALVVERAARREPLDYILSVRFGEADAAPRVRSEPPLDEAGLKCLSETLRPLAGAAPKGVRIELSAFSQMPYRFGRGGPHRMLATHAAILGWVHMDRREYETALAYFEDAYWVFHRPEYKFLIGRCLEALGRPRGAAEAYAIYVEARPDAPETPALRRHLRCDGLDGAPADDCS